MLSSLFGKKSDHPMSDIKSVQTLLAALPRDDAHKMLMELTDWVESVGENTDFKLDHYFSVLRLLDEAAQPSVRRLAREYFVPQELTKFQENRLWLVLGNWSHHIASTYFAVFDRHCNGDKGAIKAQLPLLVARAAYALRGYLKYVSAHYGPMDPLLWSKVARLYRHAEQNKYLDERIELYHGAAESTTVRCELVRLLGWYGCGVDTLSPLYLHLAECIVGQYCSSLSISAQQGTDSLFYFDLDAPAAPLRVKAGGRALPSARFISMTAMQPRLEALLNELAKNAVPQELGLGGNYAVEVVREVTQYLLHYLTDPPLRRSPRRGINVSLKVANGFGRILDHADSGRGFRVDEAQHWEVEDISATGFRTVVSMRGADGVRIGTLLGVQPDGVSHWGVAVVRRLMCDESNRLHVGAEMLAHQVAGVTLTGGIEEKGHALWLLAKSEDTSGEVRLMMKAETFTPQRSLQTRYKNKNYLLLPTRLIEQGMDYDLAGFRVVEQEGGEN